VVNAVVGFEHFQVGTDEAGQLFRCLVADLVVDGVHSAHGDALHKTIRLHNPLQRNHKYGSKSMSLGGGNGMCQ
jgi:hypothetical protein